MNLKSKLQARAKLLNEIRHFFKERTVLEVSTPVLYSGGTTDPYISSFQIEGKYLQTSPEFAMKRLLCREVGDIFQICPAFRQGESGRKHANEFTLLEWYRLDFDEHQLMQEVSELLQLVLSCSVAKTVTYQELIENNFGYNPHNPIPKKDLQNLLKLYEISVDDRAFQQKDYLDILWSHIIEPKLAMNTPLMVYNYPKSCSMLAALSTDTPQVARRFEVFYKGIELANGFFELTCGETQEARFLADQKLRCELGLPNVNYDHELIHDMKYFGLPSSSGVALGVDRLLMLQQSWDCLFEPLS